MSRLLIQKEAAAVLGVSTRTLRRLTRNKAIRAHRLTDIRGIRYALDDLEAWLAKQGRRICGLERTGADKRPLK